LSFYKNVKNINNTTKNRIKCTTAYNKGILGVAPNAKMYGYAGNVYKSQLVKSLTEAISVDNVKVLNYSVGYTLMQKTLKVHNMNKLKEELLLLVQLMMYMDL